MFRLMTREWSAAAAILGKEARKGIQVDRVRETCHNLYEILFITAKQSD